LYDVRMLRLLTESSEGNTLLIDRGFEEGDEPVKVGIVSGRIVEFRKRASGLYDMIGESVGFFRFCPEGAHALFDKCEEYVKAGRLDEPHEEAIRDLILTGQRSFGYVDATGLPWIEIDFPEDIERAQRFIFRKLSDNDVIE